VGETAETAGDPFAAAAARRTLGATEW
jgi:hypothetical protein